jgi:phosphate transport system permease protein
MDAVFKNVMRSAALLVALLLAAIIISLMVGAMPTIKAFGLKFLFTADWDPVKENFGAVIPIYGTLATSMIAMVIAVPVSVGIAMFLTEMCPEWLRRPIGVAIELLAAIPSIIYGMWGLFVFAPLFMEWVQPYAIKLFASIPLLNVIFGGPAIGIGIFTAGMILSIMAIPFISTVIREVFAQVPGTLKEAAYGLGATTWEVVWKVVLPYARIGVIGAVMLGLGRALGETMAVTFVIGNAHRFAPSLFAPGNSIASALANEFTEAVGVLHLSALIELGLILFLITLTVLTISRIMLRQLAKRAGE